MRSMRKLLAASAAMVLGFLVMAVGAALGAGGGDGETLEALDIPEVMLNAYMGASASAGEVSAECEVRWTILAGLGNVESNHGRTHGPATTFYEDGDVRPLIIGPALDGIARTRAIPDTDEGRWDRDRVWDHAVGPMQFIPSSWRSFGRDGNDDGESDPHNAFDAALGAVAHLCLSAPGDYEDRDALSRALYAYNRSASYVDEVVYWIEYYDAVLDGLATLAGVPGRRGDGPLFVCPVQGPHHFSDDFGVPRPGGRTHQGNDIFAASGTPVVSPFPGRAEANPNTLGGLAVNVYGKKGFAYNAHLSAYRQLGRVETGTVIGYVGNTGNAIGTPPHDHFEWHPGNGSAVNPFPYLTEVC
jgi:Peptidase family M23/Transglycosylase SLT domain